MFVAAHCNLLKIREIEWVPATSVSNTKKGQHLRSFRGRSRYWPFTQIPRKALWKKNLYHNTMQEQINGFIARHEHRWMSMDSGGIRLLVIVLTSPLYFPQVLFLSGVFRKA
jgi:hypothetical protein